jgi:hypothetical protein
MSARSVENYHDRKDHFYVSDDLGSDDFFSDTDSKKRNDEKRRRQEIDNNFKVVIRIRPPVPR